jgi:hypothetical protein
VTAVPGRTILLSTTGGWRELRAPHRNSCRAQGSFRNTGRGQQS